MHRNALRAGAVAAIALIAGAVGVHATPATAVETDMAISTTAIDFGPVHVASPATPVAVTLTNTGGDPFGPINMFGGAPPTAEFNASQNCQGITLPAGGSCSVTYTFTPSAMSAFNDTSSFTISETASQNDGENFSVTLAGTGVDPNATTTTAPTTTTTAPPTATPTNPPVPGNPGGGGNTPGPIGNTPPLPGAAATTTVAPNDKLDAEVEHEKAAPGQEQRATVTGYKPGETVTATEEPDRRALGAEVADSGGKATFEWIISVEDTLGSHEFIATGAESGAVSARYTVVATAAEAEESDDSGLSPWLIALLVVVVVGAIAAGGVFAYRRGRSAGGGPGDTAPPSAPEPPEPPEPDVPTQPVQQV